MKRIVYTKLLEWKKNPLRKPLLVRGARQVGKTYTIIEFGQQSFNQVHLFNFERNPELKTIFELNLDSVRIFSELELVMGKKISTDHDLLFFDEIQECPKAIIALRYFYEQLPELHLIAAGSLLEFALKDISFPVGRVQLLNMYPLTFEEYLMAMDKELLASVLSQLPGDFSPSVIDSINRELQNYFIVGGMPECVAAFVKTRSYLEVAKIQSDLIVAFRQDFSKYAGHSDKHCLNTVLNAVAQSVGEQIKYTRLADDFSQPTVKKAFELLEMARLFIRVKSTSPNGIPLGADVSDKRFKTLFLDIGLLANINGFQTETFLYKNRLAGAWNGKMAEQFVGQEFRAKYNENVYFWVRDKRGSSAEVDFLLESNNELVPVEVKSGASGKMKSLYILLEQYPEIKKAIVLTTGQTGSIPEQRLEFRPLFQACTI